MNSIDVPFPFNPVYRFAKTEHGSVRAYYDKSVDHVRKAVSNQWKDEPISGKAFLEVEFCVALPKRVSKTRRVAMMAGEILPKLPPKKLDKYLLAVIDCLVGTVVSGHKTIIRISGRVRYDEASRAILRVGKAQFLTL